MADEVLCHGCPHPKRRHASYGCMADAGSCECPLTPAELAGDAPGESPARVADLSFEPALPVEAVLARAGEAGGRLGKRADRIRGLVLELDRDLAAAQEVLDAERRVRQLAEQLEAARSRLREVKGAPPRTPASDAAPAAEPSPKVVRAWAAANGVECGPIGRVPRPVVAAYLAANGGGDA